MGDFLYVIFFIGGAIALVGALTQAFTIEKQGENIIHCGQFIMMGAAALWILSTIVMTLDNARIVTP